MPFAFYPTAGLPQTPGTGKMPYYFGQPHHQRIIGAAAQFANYEPHPLQRPPGRQQQQYVQ
jgi:hypothetical protein